VLGGSVAFVAPDHSLAWLDEDDAFTQTHDTLTIGVVCPVVDGATREDTQELELVLTSEKGLWMTASSSHYYCVEDARRSAGGAAVFVALPHREDDRNRRASTIARPTQGFSMTPDAPCRSDGSNPASEKAEIIRLVEQSALPIKRTLEKLGIPRATFYRC
jgi:hypothetical protein